MPYKKPEWPEEVTVSATDRFTRKHGGGTWRIAYADFGENTICLLAIDSDDEWSGAGQDLLDDFIKTPNAKVTGLSVSEGPVD